MVTPETPWTPLSQITAAFMSLADDDRILLLDYLADEGLIEIDTQRAAREWAHAKWDDADRADYEADWLIPQGDCGALVWREHRAKRDARLTRLLNNERIGA